MTIATPPWKKSLSSFSATPSKSWGPVKPPPLFENLVGGSLPPPPTPAERGGGWTLCSPGISTSDSTRELSDASFSALSKTKEAPLFLFSDKLELSDGSLLTVSLLFE